MLSGTSTEEKLGIEIPKMMTDPLGALHSLQKLFSTDIFKKGYESWKYTVKNHNRFYISTKDEGQYVLGVKNGYIWFYQSDGKLSEKVDLSGVDVSTVLMKFYKALEKCNFCKIITTEINNGGKTKLTLKLKFEKGSIIRYFIDSEYTDHDGGCNGDL